MPEPELFLLFVRPLNRSGIRYMVGGSVAAIFYGQPRVTHDVDLVVFLTDQEAHRLADFFPAADFYVPTVEIILSEIHRPQHGHFNLIHMDTSFKADFFLVGRDDLNAWGFRFKRTEQFSGERVILAPPEYIIVKKLEYYREGRSEKHLIDIRSMLDVSGGDLDQPALNEWIQRRGLEKEWGLVSS